MLEDLFASPDHYLHSFDGDAAIFVPMDRAAYSRSIFLDGRISAAADGSMRLPFATLAARAEPLRGTGWIFHVAHCGSTLLARALDQGSGTLVLREPLALRQVAITPDRARLTTTLAMLSKRYDPALPSLVKANVPVNFLLPDLCAAEPDAHAIFLYFALDDYLLAILRNDRHREWVRSVTSLLAPHLGDLTGQPDPVRAAALWLAQIRAFKDAIALLPNARSLDAEIFFAEPRCTVRTAAALLDVPIGDEALDAMLAGPLFSTYSKNPDLPFDNEARVARRQDLEKQLGAEIEQARHWLAPHHAEIVNALTALQTAALV